MTTAQHNELLLDAGAVLPVGALAGAGRPDSAADVLDARAYGHPALGARRVVRLVPRALGAAEDLALDFLGLSRAADPAEVGQVRQEALGFPAWALIHDPANGHHALALVKEMERLGHQAKSKPGYAKDGFDRLAVRLGRAVPHFLPTYCEQVGRIYLELGNSTYAATYFGKAREAERTYGLEVDEERLRAVFLEFALAGALTVKALRQYVKELSGRLDGQTAWERFRQLCAERSAAGMAPYGGVAEDARSLIKAAGLDRAEHEQALLAELVAAPSVSRAPGAFWKSWRVSLLELAQRDATVRARLLEITPNPSGSEDQESVDAAWLELLAESGAERLLTDAQEPGAVPAAAWLRRWMAHLGRGWRASSSSVATLALVGRMAERLRSEGVPVDLFGGRRCGATELNLLDLLLVEGVPVADPPHNLDFHLNVWLRLGGPGRRDLAAVAADPRFRPALKAGVPSVWPVNPVGEAGERMTGTATLETLFAEWADDRAAELLAATGLAGAQSLLTSLDPARSAIMAANPRAAERIASLDVAALLGRALRTGIADELGWSALEEGLRRLGVEDSAHPGVLPGKERKVAVLIEDAWPALILSQGDKVVVVGPQEVLLEHDLRIPDKLDHWRRVRLRYVDGELLVGWYHDGKQRGYWSGRPAEVVTLGGDLVTRYYGQVNDWAPASVPLPGGGRATGGRVLHAGDTTVPVERQVLSDGTGYWTLRHTAGRAALVEYDPATGAIGRASVPPQFAGADGAAEPVPEASSLLPMQAGLEDSPLGTDGTVLGSWVRTGDGRVTAQSPDGRTAVLPHGGHGTRLGRYPVGRLTLPGGADPLLVRGWQKTDLSLTSPEGTGGKAEVLADLTAGRPGELHAAGTALVPPVEHWHALRPRDEHGSRLLRAVTDDRAVELFDAAWPVDAADAADAADAENAEDAEDAAEREQNGRQWLVVQGVRRQVAGARATAVVPTEAVGRVLPGLTHPLLVAGVAGLARIATDTATRAARFTPRPEAEAAARSDDAMPAPYRPEHGLDRRLREAVGGVFRNLNGFGNYWGPEKPDWGVLANLRTVSALLAAERPADTAGQGTWSTDPERLKLHRDTGYHGWIHLLGRLGPVVMAAASPVIGPAERASLALLLTELTQGPLADQGGFLREVILSETVGPVPVGDHRSRVGQVLRLGARTVVVLACQHHQPDQRQWVALDHDPSGEFGPVADFGILRERRMHEQLPAARIAEYAALIRQHGGFPWRPEPAAAFGAATGIGRARAALLLAAPPNLFTWSWQFLKADRLKELDLRTTDATPAVSWLRQLSETDQHDLLTALLPVEPERLWSEGPAVGPAAELWQQRIGRIVTLPDEAKADLHGARIESIEQMLNVERTPWLTRTTEQRVRPVDTSGSQERHLVADDPSAVPVVREISGAVAALRWLAYHLPYGDPLRALLPGAFAAVRTRLSDPGLLLNLDLVSTPKGAMLAPVLRAQAGLPEQGGAGGDGLVPCGEALVLAPWRTGGEIAYLRPTGLTGADDPLFELLAGLTGSFEYRSESAALRAVLGEDLRRLVTHGATEAEPVGWAQDPQLSAPALVTEVARTHGLGEDAAALYLQLLALPDPTDRNVARWTGWKPARLKRARVELAVTDLVLEAKRARAGRTLFLPGGWQEAKSPGLPVEIWKGGLYQLPAGEAILPHLSVPELFALAWQRIGDGDLPGYEQLQTNTRKKGRRR